jgi:molecular chaperone DnaK (HSP70)
MKQYMVYVAIDFGTSRTGVSFRFKSSDQSNIIVWESEFKDNKTSTSVLFDRSGNCIAFGDEARTTYSNLDEDELEQYSLFERFKMEINNISDVRKTIVSLNGKAMELISVVRGALACIKKKVLKHLTENAIGCFRDDEIKWSLTVPAIWDERAKQFMISAAKQVFGVQPAIVLEPEAASVISRNYIKEHHKDLESITGYRYMVLDCGGGTIDITIHEIEEDGTLKSLHEATGGAWEVCLSMKKWRNS